MKRVVVSLLFILLMSCGGSHPQNYVEIQRAGESQAYGYSLLDVRDSFLMVRPYDRFANTGTAKMSIPASTVERISIQNNTTGYGFLGCFAGVIAGAGVTAGLVESDHSGNFMNVMGNLFIGTMSILGLGIGGCAIAEDISDGTHTLDLATPDAWMILKERCSNSE